MGAGSKGTERKQEGDQGAMHVCLSHPKPGWLCHQPILSVPGATADTLVSPLHSSPLPVGLLPQEGMMGTPSGSSAQARDLLASVLSQPACSLIYLPGTWHFCGPLSSPSPPPRWRALTPHRALCAGPQPASSPALHPGGPGHLCVSGKTPQLRS